MPSKPEHVAITPNGRPPSGPLDLAEVGVPSRPRDSSTAAVRRFAALSGKGGALPNEGKNKWQRTFGSLPAISGESVKGGYPLSPSERGESRAQTPERKRLGPGATPTPVASDSAISNDQSELAAARRQRRAREFRLPARSAGRFGRGACPPNPNTSPSLPTDAPLPDRSTYGRCSRVRLRGAVSVTRTLSSMRTPP